MSKSLSCGSEEGRSVDGVSRSPRTVGAADGIISPRVGIRLRDPWWERNLRRRGVRETRERRTMGGGGVSSSYVPASASPPLRLIAGARGGRRTARRRGVLLTGVRDPALAPGITGAGFANSPAFAPGAGARNAFPCDEASTPPALSVPAWASISLLGVRRRPAGVRGF